MKRIAVFVILLLLPIYAFSQDDDVVVDIEDDKSSYSSPFAQPKFVPNISLILDFSYTYRDFRDEEYQDLVIPGFMDVHSSSNSDDNEGLYEYSDARKRGFNLNYGELAFEAAIDPYFDLFANFTLGEDSFAIEELYFNTRSMPLNFQIKGGRFLSNFGRLNPQHAHYWDFNDLPVVYNVFLGEGLLENGVQISWLAPFDFYLMIGGEVLQGENETSFGAEGFKVEKGSVLINKSKGPNISTGFIKTSLDTDNFIILAGLSCAIGKTRQDNNVNSDQENGYAIDTDTGIYGADLTLKYLIDSYRYIMLQGEYLYRYMKGSIYSYSGTRSNLEKKQSGMYVQLVVKPFKQWRFGTRYDLLHKNEIYVEGILNEDIPENMDRYSGMIEYNFTEFSRFRIQYNYDRTKCSDYEQKDVHEIVFACNLAIGAHGAHKF